MVLKDDNINQTMLVPMDLRNLIPEDHPCYFIKNVVDLIDCSKANNEFRGKPGEFAYPRELQEKLREKHALTLHICILQRWKNHHIEQ